MADINVFTFTGRVVRDAELITKSNGLVICDFSVANNYTKKSADVWTKGVNYFDVALFGKRASSLHTYLKQGVLVGVEAEVRQHRWEQEGKKRVANQLVILDVHLLSSAQKRTESKEASEETNLAYSEEFDLPEEERYQEDIF